MPLYKLLGAYTDRVPIYSSGGYYRQGESFQQMADEAYYSSLMFAFFTMRAQFACSSSRNAPNSAGPI